ncbi:hypothetical protein J2X34_002842 [Rhodococcus sp. BE178]
MAFGANLSDGYALGMIGAVLPSVSAQLGLTSFGEGMIASSALIGLFFGSMILGRGGDIIGRQRLYVLNFALIAAVSLLQLWTPNVLILFVLRVLIGFGLGADYAVGADIDVRIRAPEAARSHARVADGCMDGGIRRRECTGHVPQFGPGCVALVAGEWHDSRPDSSRRSHRNTGIP